MWKVLALVMVALAVAGCGTASVTQPAMVPPTAVPSFTIIPSATSVPTRTPTSEPTPTSSPTYTETPVPTDTPTPSPAEMTQTAQAAYQETRAARQTATRAFNDRLKEYVRIDAINDFMGYPGHWSGEKIVIRGEVYDILHDGSVVHLWLTYGYNGDFILVVLESPLGLESGVMRGYKYNIYGTVSPCTESFNLNGYCITDAFIPLIRE